MTAGTHSSLRLDRSPRNSQKFLYGRMKSGNSTTNTCNNACLQINKCRAPSVQQSPMCMELLDEARPSGRHGETQGPRLSHWQSHMLHVLSNVPVNSSGQQQPPFALSLLVQMPGMHLLKCPHRFKPFSCRSTVNIESGGQNRRIGPNSAWICSTSTARPSRSSRSTEPMGNTYPQYIDG